MNSIREIQYKKVKKLYLDLIKHRGEEPDISDIEKLAREIIYSTERTPLSGKYRIEPHRNVDVNSMNVELGLIKADMETISDFLDQIQRRMRTAAFACDVWNSYAAVRSKKAMYDMARLTSSMFINDFTAVIDLQSMMNTEVTTMVPDSDGALCLPGLTSSSSDYTYQRSDIVIRPTVSGMSVDVYGSPTSVLNPEESGFLVLSLKGRNVGDAGFYIKITTISDAVNNLSLTTGELKDGLKVVAYITDDSSNRTLIYSGITTNPNISIPFDEQNVREVELYLTMSNPNIISPSEIRYEFSVSMIRLISEARKMSAVYQTKEIEIEKGTSYLSLVTNEDVLGAATIKYYLATNKTSNGEPDGFIFVDTHKEGNVVNVNVSTGAYTLSPESTAMWSIPSMYKYGHRLYNILDITGGTTVDDNECYSISDRITAKSGSVINRESLRLYRGSGDYLVTESNAVIERTVELIASTPELNTDTDWVKRIPLLIKITEAIPPDSITSEAGMKDNAVTLPYVIKSPDTVKITREDKKEIKSIITAITSGSGSTKISFAGTAGASLLDPSYRYSITYTVTLEDYINANDITVSIDPADVDVVVDGEDFVNLRDFQVYSDTMEIELLKSGNYYRYYDVDDTGTPVVNMCSPVSVSYRFKGTYNKTVRHFETNVYCNIQTSITVIPFTPAESAVGNYHLINGTNTGTQRTILLNAGWNTIKTTHPYPSMNDYDVNSITLEPSNAGIVLPDNMKIRPYTDSMRQVSPFMLMNMDPVSAAKCFAFVDGKILLSFVPTFIDPELVSKTEMSDMMGEVFINKKPVINQYYKTTAWTSFPEAFDIEFTYDDNTEKSLFIRAEVDVKNTNSTARILKVGINQYKEN